MALPFETPAFATRCLQLVVASNTRRPQLNIPLATMDIYSSPCATSSSSSSVGSIGAAVNVHHPSISKVNSNIAKKLVILFYSFKTIAASTTFDHAVEELHMAVLVNEIET